jgi:hypothetical protein
MQLRLIELARAGWGGALLFAPRVVLSRVHHVEVDTKRRSYVCQAATLGFSSRLAASMRR